MRPPSCRLALVCLALLAAGPAARAQPTVGVGAPTFTVAEGAGKVTVGVTLSAPSTQTVTVQYATRDGAAVAPGDYTAKTGTLVFAPGETAKPVEIPLVNDTTPESAEDFFFDVSNPQNATLDPSRVTAKVTITDDDSGGTPPAVEFGTANFTVAEDGMTATIGVKLSAAASGTVTVQYATSDGTATAGEDYTAASGTLTFAVGETAKTFSVKIIDDVKYESNETVVLTLSAPSGATLGAQKTATLTITDNDPPPPPTVEVAVVSDPYPNPVTALTGWSGTLLEATATPPSPPASPQGPFWQPWQIEKLEYKAEPEGVWLPENKAACSASFLSLPPSEGSDPNQALVELSLLFQKTGYWKVTVRATAGYANPGQGSQPSYFGSATVELPTIFACGAGGEIAVAKVEWTAYENKDKNIVKDNYIPQADLMKDKGGGDVLFAEQNHPSGAVDAAGKPLDEVHNKVLVTVTLDKAPPKGLKTKGNRSPHFPPRKCEKNVTFQRLILSEISFRGNFGRNF